MSLEGSLKAQIFGERVRTSRKRLRLATGKGVTQGTLATLVGVDRNTVSRWENGGMLPKDPATIAALSRVLKVSADWLVGDLEALPVGGTARQMPALNEPLEVGADPLWGTAEFLPAQVADVVQSYLERLTLARVSAPVVREAERALVHGVRHRLSPVPFEERELDEMVSDLDAAWDFLVAVFRRQGMRL